VGWQYTGAEIEHSSSFETKRLKPMRPAIVRVSIALVIITIVQAQDPLPSWNDTGSKKTVLTFFEKVTKEGSAVIGGRSSGSKRTDRIQQPPSLISYGEPREKT
jgi:hypothetical protein